MSIFKYNIEIDKNAYLNWRINKHRTLSEQLSQIGLGYLLAAETAIKLALQDNRDKKADIMIFPILFNLIHAIEIYLKAINIDVEFLLTGREISAEGKHAIQNSFSTLLGKIKKLEGKEATSQFDEVKDVVDEIYTKTDKMDFARYPIDSNKNNHFYVEDYENVVIDLEEILIFVDKCKDVFGRMSSYYQSKVEACLTYE